MLCKVLRRVNARAAHPDYRSSGGSHGRWGVARAVGALTGASALVLAVLAASLPGTFAAGAATATPVNTLYVLSENTPSLLSFAPGSVGNVAPSSTISGTPSTLNNPYGMALDSSGNVWVANFNANTLLEFTQAQLAVGGSPAPTVVLSTTGGGSINHPSSLAFDRSGDL